MPAPTKTRSADRTHWLIERRVRVYPRIFLTMFALAVPAYASTFTDGLDTRGRPAGTDFIAFWSAGRFAVDGHPADAWDLGVLGAFQLAEFPGLVGPTQWAYPPPTQLFVMPLGLLSHSIGLLVWTLAGAAVFLCALAPALKGRQHAWPIALAFPGLWFGIGSGQIQFFVAALLGGAMIALPRRPMLAGVLIGLLVIKPQLAVLAPVALIAGRQWRAFLAAAVTATTCVLASLLVIGATAFEAWGESLNVLDSAIDGGGARLFKHVSPYLGLRLAGMDGGPAIILQAVISIAGAWGVWSLWRRSTDIRIRGSALIVGTFLVTPYAGDYDLAVLAFPVAWIASLGVDGGWIRGDRNLLVATWLLPAVAAPVAVLTKVMIVPFVMALLLHHLWLHAHRGDGVHRTRQEVAAET